MKRKLQVFVSSTYTDLLEERQAAVAAILKAGHMPAGMELFTAGDQSQLDTIKKWIDECDVYLLILGARYGSIEPISQKSYTEVEFEYAESLSKPLFSIVASEKNIDEKVSKHGRVILEADNPQLLKSFREKVLKNISSFYEDTKDIRLAIYESLKSYEGDSRIIGWMPANIAFDIEKIKNDNASLKEENAQLKFLLEKTKNAKGKADEVREQMKDIAGHLKKKMMNVPAGVTSSGKELNISLFDIFISAQDVLINGVTNHNAGSEYAKFLFHDVAPKLRVFGLIDVEKITGGPYRRALVSKFGLEFLSECQRMPMDEET